MGEQSDKKKKKTKASEDRLSDLPEELQLRILGYLDTKQAVQTMILSRSWVSLWTRIPILEINHFSFQNHNNNSFPKFVNEVLSRRDPLAKLDRVKLNNNFDKPEILNSVFEYAFSHGVKHLEASTESPVEIDSWPVCRLCDSLTSLQLQSKDGGYRKLKCPFLGPRYGILFKNLTVLYLEFAYIPDVDPFSGFQQLESLTLIECGPYEIERDKIFKVHAPRLSDLTISNLRWSCLELSTPRLRFLKYRGPQILLKHHEGEGVPVLETLDINFNGLHYNTGTCGQLEFLAMHKLMSFFSTLPPNIIKSLTLLSPTVILLSLFPTVLLRQPSPFRDLKHLKLDFSRYSPCNKYYNPCSGWYDSVKAYFLRNSPDAECTITYPEDIDAKTLLMQLIPKTKKKIR